MKLHLIQLASAGVAGLALAQPVHAATILTGSGLANNTTLPANHGSNAVGTPNITLAWSPAGALGWQAYNGWPSSGGQVYQLDGPGSSYTGAITYNIAFAPSSGSIGVLLTSLTLNDWSGGGGATILNWSVTGSVSGVFGSGIGLSVADGTAQTLNLGYQGVGGETLTLALTPTGGSGSYFAVDNISFDQVAVPEPSSALLAGAGLGALALRRRRK